MNTELSNLKRIEYGRVTYYYKMSCGEPILQYVEEKGKLTDDVFGWHHDFDIAYMDYEEGEIENRKNDWL